VPGRLARGDGDADRARIFAQAYAFYRSMQAYEAALQPSNTRLVLPPDSRFFRFFGGPSAAPRSK
jgi:membrane protease subunit HflC